MALHHKPIQPPYSSQVHQAAWREWDRFVEENPPELNTATVRAIFMEGFKKGLNYQQTDE